MLKIFTPFLFQIDRYLRPSPLLSFTQAGMSKPLASALILDLRFRFVKIAVSKKIYSNQEMLSTTVTGWAMGVIKYSTLLALYHWHNIPKKKNIFCFSSRNLFAGTLENAQTERSATEQNSGKNSSNPAFWNMKSYSTTTGKWNKEGQAGPAEKRRRCPCPFEPLYCIPFWEQGSLFWALGLQNFYVPL